MGKYYQLCNKYEKTLFEDCRELKTENVKCEILKQLYNDCLKFINKREKPSESIK